MEQAPYGWRIGRRVHVEWRWRREIEAARHAVGCGLRELLGVFCIDYPLCAAASAYSPSSESWRRAGGK